MEPHHHLPIQLVVTKATQELSNAVYDLLIAAIAILVLRPQHAMVHVGDEVGAQGGNQLSPGI